MTWLRSLVCLQQRMMLLRQMLQILQLEQKCDMETIHPLMDLIGGKRAMILGEHRKDRPARGGHPLARAGLLGAVAIVVGVEQDVRVNENERGHTSRRGSGRARPMRPRIRT